MLIPKKATPKNLYDRIKKLAYGLFVMWLGVLAPLVYFDEFAVSHHVQPFRFSLVEGRHRAITTPRTAAFTDRLAQRLKQRLTHQQDVISTHSPFPGLALALQWSLGQISLIAGSTGLLYLMFRRLNLAHQLVVASPDLPAPKKPPRLL